MTRVVPRPDTGAPQDYARLLNYRSGHASKDCLRQAMCRSHGPMLPCVDAVYDRAQMQLHMQQPYAIIRAAKVLGEGILWDDAAATLWGKP